VPSPIFTGPSSLRHPRERVALIGTLIWSIPAALAIGFVLHQSIGASQVALFIVIAMVYVTLKRGYFIGSSVMIHEAQSPRVFAIVKRACAALEIPMPLIFVREEAKVPAAALGFGEPYSLILSSDFIDHFEDDEFAFIIGRQLGHIAAGHTRFLSLLSVNGEENALIAMIFGPWLRTCELTCDKVGLLVCGTVESAARAIAIASFKHFGRKVDLEKFAEQGREVANDNVLRLGEWLGGEPYATRRINEMKNWSQTHQFSVMEEWFVRERDEEPPAIATATSRTVERADCAGWWRRAAAFSIDIGVVIALMQIFPSTWGDAWHKVLTGRTNDIAAKGFLDVLFNRQMWITAIYLWASVSIIGQSFGMMIVGVRVVRVDFTQPGVWRCMWRYVLAASLSPLIFMLSFINRRIMLHDRWSKTRLITAERALARATQAESVTQSANVVVQADPA
jgi:Zn-dependent protease with chaperone function